MKKFLLWKWRSIPMGIIAAVLIVCLMAGSAFAAYSFLSFTTEVSVDEPLTIEYNLQGQYGGDSNWHPLGDEDSLTIAGSAGDSFNIDLRINNRANGALTVNTATTGDTSYFTLTGFPNGTIPASDGDDTVPEWSNTTTLKIKGDAPPGTYSLTFSFERS
jgi:hypothetical protein